MANESRYSIIEDLRDLGVNTVAILACNPTAHQLQDMRDGLLKLCDTTKVVRKYRTSGNKPRLVFLRE